MGVGWWLALVDLICSEYHWQFADVMQLPVNRALCLRAAISHRLGCPVNGAEFLQREFVRQLKLS